MDDRLDTKRLVVAIELKQDAPVAYPKAPLAFQSLQAQNIAHPGLGKCINRGQHPCPSGRVEPSQIPTRPARKLDRPDQAPNSRSISSRVKVRPALKSSIPS